MDEYKHIQELRQTWSGFIMDWLRIMIPVGAAFDVFFSYLGTRNTGNPDYSYVFPFLGWLIFVIPLITWRVVVHYIDRQIVRLYPRMLELEQQMLPPWHTHAAYYFNNLKREARRFLLEQQLGVSRNDAREFSYRQYTRRCRQAGADPHLSLLQVWDEQRGHQSVTSRGHLIQHVAVGFICFMALAIGGFLAWGISSQDSQCWIHFTIAISVTAVVAVIFALLAALCLIKR